MKLYGELHEVSWSYMKLCDVMSIPGELLEVSRSVIKELLLDSTWKERLFMVPCLCVFKENWRIV